MIIADLVEYNPLKTDNQGNYGACVGYAVLGAVRELVQQYYNVDLDFDILRIFNDIDAKRKQYQDRTTYFLREGMTGYVSTNETLVKLTGIQRVTLTVDDVCQRLQTYGVLIVVVEIFKELQLAGKDQIIKLLPPNPTPTNSAHAMQIIGFDRTKKLFKIQNSWNESTNIKYIPFEELLQISSNIFSILGIQIFPKTNDKNMITALKQGDPRWASSRIGNTSQTVAAKGCTITSLCMALEKLRGYPASPADAAKYWAFDSSARIIWTQTQFSGMKFIWRGYDADWGKIIDYNAEDKAVILTVNNSSHWIYVEDFVEGRCQIIDPIDGKRYDGVPDKYKVCGYALFEKN